jgi:hypothetical protein
MVPKEDMEGSEIHQMNTLPGQSERNSNDSGASAVSTNQDPDPEVLPDISHDEGVTFSFHTHYRMSCQIINTNTLLDK